MLALKSDIRRQQFNFYPPKVGESVPTTSKSRGTCPPVQPRIYAHEFCYQPCASQNSKIGTNKISTRVPVRGKDGGTTFLAQQLDVQEC